MPTYDLEERTLNFAIKVKAYIKNKKCDFVDKEYFRQLIRSSASIGANYLEANEKLSNKDFLLRVKIARKEAKETTFWLKIITGNKASYIENNLKQEATEFVKILSSIIEKRKNL